MKSELLYPENEPECINILSYFKSTQDVKEYMKTQNVLFLGCCKNVSIYIPTLLYHINNCGNKFNSFQVLLYESNSIDNTRQVLLNNIKDNYIYIFDDYKINTCNINTENIRTLYLERGRNILLDEAKKLNTDNKYQYLIILDTDDVNSSGDFVNSIETCFYYNTWDVLFSNKKNGYYDLWALRKKKDCEYDIWKSFFKTHTSCLNYEPGYLLEVDSAFGGIAIYRFSDILKQCYYSNGCYTCEHIHFNKSIKKKGGKLYINTSFYN